MRSWATSGFARVRLDDVVEGSAGVVRVAAVGVGAVIEKPLERFRFEILARCEEHRKPAPAEPVDVGTVTYQELHHRNAAGVRHSHERHVVDEDLAKFGDGGQECLDAREVVGGDRLLELLGLIAGVAEVGTIGKFHERNPFRGPDASLTRGSAYPKRDTAATVVHTSLAACESNISFGPRAPAFWRGT
jgi:hypothetical protein